jgi:hypothetical protein
MHKIRTMSFGSGLSGVTLPDPEAVVLVRKLNQLIPLSLAKRANHRYFIVLCGISCELASCVHWPIVDSEPMPAEAKQNLNQLHLSRLSLAKLAKLNFFKLPPLSIQFGLKCSMYINTFCYLYS